VPRFTAYFSKYAMAGNLSPDKAHDAFRNFVLQPEFPCVGARAAFNSSTYELSVFDALASEATTAALGEELFRFTRSAVFQESEYATFVAVFRSPLEIDETDFDGLFCNSCKP